MTEFAVYGAPPAVLAAADPSAIQVSPLIVDSRRIEDLRDRSIAHFTLYAPPGTLERRYAMAQALRLLSCGLQ